MSDQSIANSVEIVAIGEVLVEIMRPGAGQPLDGPGEFRGPFASGAPAIFAVAAARLGLKTGFIGTIGEDAFGRLLRNSLAQEGVDTLGLQAAPGYATGAAFVAYAEDGSREFVFHIRHAAAGQLSEDRIPEAYFKDIKWLHISGSTLALNDNSRAACLRALELTQSAGGKVSLDPNLRPELMPLDAFSEVLKPYLASADLILPTTGEAQAITGEKDIAAAARVLAKKPSTVVALKRGPLGCAIYHQDQTLEIPGFTVTEIDPTGAGDCFSAAFIAGLQAGWPMELVGRFANAAGALAVTQLGPIEGAPARDQVEKFYG